MGYSVDRLYFQNVSRVKHWCFQKENILFMMSYPTRQMKTKHITANYLASGFKIVLLSDDDYDILKLF